MLKKVKVLNYAADYSYAPPQEDAVINTDDISIAMPADQHRGSGPFVNVTMRDGRKITIVGTVDDLLKEGA